MGEKGIDRDGRQGIAGHGQLFDQADAVDDDIRLDRRKGTNDRIEVVRIDEARQLLLVRGAVPGAKGGDVIVAPAVKASTERG